jgi:hypothetical protein
MPAALQDLAALLDTALLDVDLRDVVPRLDTASQDTAQSLPAADSMAEASTVAAPAAVVN